MFELKQRFDVGIIRFCGHDLLSGFPRSLSQHYCCFSEFSSSCPVQTLNPLAMLYVQKILHLNKCQAMTLKLRRIFLVGGGMMKIHQFDCEMYFNIMEKTGRRQIQVPTNRMR